MTIQSATTLKSYFQAGDKPTEAQFADLIDSALYRGPYEYDASAAVVSADDSIALKTAGVNRVTVDASGNIGVFGPVSFAANVVASANVQVAGSLTVGAVTSAARRFHVNDTTQIVARISSSNTLALQEFADANTTLMPRIGSQGNDLISQVGGTVVTRTTPEGFIINNGTTMRKYLAGVVSGVDFGSTSPSLSSSVTFTVSGAVPGDNLLIWSDMDSDYLFLGNGKIISANTIKVRLFSTFGTVNPAPINVSYQIT